MSCSHVLSISLFPVSLHSFSLRLLLPPKGSNGKVNFRAQTISVSFLRLSYSESRTCLSAPNCCSGGGSRGVGEGEEHKQNYLASRPSSSPFLYFLVPRCHPPPKPASSPRDQAYARTQEAKPATKGSFFSLSFLSWKSVCANAPFAESHEY